MLNSNIVWIFILIHGYNAVKDLEECQTEYNNREKNNVRVVGGHEARPGK